MNRFRAYAAAVFVLCAVLPLGATTIVLPEDPQLIAKSPVIVEALVLSSSPVERDGKIWTETRLAVSRTLKGETASEIQVREIGGRVGDRETKIFGTPQFTEGERVLLFLEPAPLGGYRTMDLFVGKFTAAETVEGQRLWIRDRRRDAMLLDADFRPIEPTNAERDASGFETYIRQRAAGQPGDASYGVADVVLSTARTGRWNVSSEFALIASQIYRWTQFERGQVASWYSIGTQTGYSGGGISELQTAMAAWTTYGAANIRYSYAGARTGSTGGLDSPNNYNEVLFDDPLNEIAGSFSRTEGGVVGIGGFNRVQSGPTWVAPFDADSFHTAGAKSTVTIIEGNLTIQDGVSPTNGISANVLAEILAHEFGHTLGFGHSADSTALMYDTVTRLGPALRADDQAAARWLYPAGATNPPPAAPSELAATVSGDDVSLSWLDNSEDEAGFRIYRDGTLRASVGQNVRTYTDTNLSNGTYSFTVRSYDADGEASSSPVSVTVNVVAPPVANFSAPSAFVNQAVTLSSSSTGSITSAVWDFGDGSQASGLTVSHTYTRAGTYKVKLTVGNSSGTSSVERELVVIGNPVASFSWQPPFPTTNDTLTFIDESTGLPSTWSWDFGDGTTSTQQNPTKRFATPGTKSVRLTVQRGNASDSLVKQVTVASVVPGTPTVVAAFDGPTAAIAVGTAVTFTDQSTGSPSRWAWTFGDGGESSAQNPSHTWSVPGTYTVTLIASNASNSSTASRQVVVNGLTPFRSLLSVAAQTAGVNGTSWRTEMTIFNAGTQTANGTITFIPGAGGAVLTESIALAPKQSITWANALQELFGLENAGGALAVEASSAGATADLRVASRTYTGGAAGTYGQAVPDVPPGAMLKTLYVTGLAAGTNYRTNVGLVNRSDVLMNTTLTLLTPAGAVIANKTVPLQPYNFQQSSLGAMFPELGNSAYDVLTLRVSSSADAAISAYASVVDNATQDPVYIQGVPALAGGVAMIPVVGRSPGVNGTYWRSDVTVFNPTSTLMSVGLRYRGTTKLLSVGAGDTKVLSDVLGSLGVTSGSGPLEILWTSAGGPVVTSRTYTSVESGGTYGQSIEPVAAFSRSAFVPGLRSDGIYRTNIGFVNSGSASETFTVRLLSPSGTELARTTHTLGAGELSQNAVTTLFPNTPLPAGFALHIEGDADSTLFAYASMVDNQSGDPVFFAGR